MPTRKPKPPEPDWAKIDALTDEEIDAQIAADPDVAPALTEEWFEKADKLDPIDVKAIRTRLGMSQPKFAETFWINLAVLRDWEQRRHVPRGPALALLRIIEREPEAARRALNPAGVEATFNSIRGALRGMVEGSAGPKRRKVKIATAAEQESRAARGRAAGAAGGGPKRRVIRSPIAVRPKQETEG